LNWLRSFCGVRNRASSGEARSVGQSLFSPIRDH
jgi:hypothetical protein